MAAPLLLRRKAVLVMLVCIGERGGQSMHFVSWSPTIFGGGGGAAGAANTRAVAGAAQKLREVDTPERVPDNSHLFPNTLP